MWPEIFRKAGYRTIGVGKWHNDRTAFNRAFSAGGAIFFGGMTNQWHVPVYDYDPAGLYPRGAAHISDIFSSELFANTAIQFIQTVKKPFVLYVAFTAPHDPRTPPAEFANMYPPDSIVLPPNFLPEHPFDNGEMTVRDEMLLPVPRTPEAVRKELAAYYGMISNMDAQIGRILDALCASGHGTNTLVVFASDHGLAIGSHGLLGKQNLYEHSMRAPLIFAGPGITPNRQSKV